jgi:hypothetical protein
MELQLSSTKWCPIKARGRKKTTKGMHTVKEVDMLATKMDLILKRLDERATEKEAMKTTIQATDSQMTCEVCGEIGPLGNTCPEACEDAAYINNGFRQQNNRGWNNNQSHSRGDNSNFNSNFNSNQPSLKDLVLGQAKINENLTKS